MAPSKASKSKSSGLTQSRLDFRAGRGLFAVKPEEKTAKALQRSRTIFATASDSSSSNSDSDRAGDDQNPGRSFRPVSKRIKIDTDDGPVALSSEDVSRSRTRSPAETEDSALPPVTRPKLNVKDKRYSEQYVKIRRQMGNLEPSEPIQIFMLTAMDHTHLL